MYRVTVSASRLAAYNSESGSFSETRHTPLLLVPERRPGQVLGQESGNRGGGVRSGEVDHGSCLIQGLMIPARPHHRPIVRYSAQ
jgi:hypothetical protein